MTIASEFYVANGCLSISGESYSRPVKLSAVDGCHWPGDLSAEHKTRLYKLLFMTLFVGRMALIAWKRQSTFIKNVVPIIAGDVHIGFLGITDVRHTLSNQTGVR